MDNIVLFIYFLVQIIYRRKFQQNIMNIYYSYMLVFDKEAFVIFN